MRQCSGSGENAASPAKPAHCSWPFNALAKLNWAAQAVACLNARGPRRAIVLLLHPSYSIRELLCRAHVHDTIVLARAHLAGVHPLVLRQDLGEAFLMRRRAVTKWRPQASTISQSPGSHQSIIRQLSLGHRSSVSSRSLGRQPSLSHRSVIAQSSVSHQSVSTQSSVSHRSVIGRS